ncbi:hypothetical protein C5C04_10625 [Rathayibacter rathayi]|uniref:Uncharacterized protein n=1 Tax=Rathayibacter rathayi TaxID=33887 RepID=A0ABD6W6Z0_RATRA|nr:hypothetical protein C5C04_10625 [Rathayibacter rathayi]
MPIPSAAEEIIVWEFTAAGDSRPRPRGPPFAKQAFSALVPLRADADEPASPASRSGAIEEPEERQP